MRERLYRSRTDRILFGVAGGVADWLDVDPALVRIVFALLVFAGMLMFIRMPVAESFIMSRTRPSNRSSILGVYYFLNMEIGAVLSPFAGILIDRFGFTSTLSGGAALVLVITVAASFFLIGTRR